MEYIYELAWLILWPIVIYASWKISIKNVLKFEQK